MYNVCIVYYSYDLHVIIFYLHFVYYWNPVHTSRLTDLITLWGNPGFINRAHSELSLTEPFY